MGQRSGQKLWNRAGPEQIACALSCREQARPRLRSGIAIVHMLMAEVPGPDAGQIAARQAPVAPPAGAAALSPRRSQGHRGQATDRTVTDWRWIWTWRAWRMAGLSRTSWG